MQIILPLNIFSQEVIQHNGKRYVDAEYTNQVIDKYNECRELLKQSRDNHEKEIQIVEKVVVQDKKIIEYIEKESTENKWKYRGQGAAAGGGSVLIIVLLVILL